VKAPITEDIWSIFYVKVLYDAKKFLCLYKLNNFPLEHEDCC
jgi:hypothetical protein